MIIGIDMGHTLSGKGTGAAGIVKETDRNRELGKLLINYLRSNGHTVIDCTVDSSSNDLVDRVAKANAQKLDLFISIHLNAGGGHGTETYVYNKDYPGKAANKEIAKKVNDAVVNSCGFRNRGIKEANFHVLRETVAPAILVEVCFVDSQEDTQKWNADKIARAMFTAITGQSISESKPQSDVFYRVIVGSYQDKKNAEAMVEELKKKGYSAFIAAYTK